VQISNLAWMLPGKVPTWPLKIFFEKGAWPGSKWLKIQTSNLAHMHAPRESRHMTPENFFPKGVRPGSRDPINFWALNANSSKMTKDTNFKFGRHAPMDSVSSDKALIGN